MLLERLGYIFDESLKTYTHPEHRKIVVLGDFINVGMQNKEILYT
ncbi:MAG: protein phosphatase, partial [Bacteroidales bacterium]|nr:protein phosphatase [Bacteroidales bacterium]